MKRLIVPLVILLVSVFIITGCGTAAPSTTTTPTSSTPTAATPTTPTTASPTTSATPGTSNTPANSTSPSTTPTSGGSKNYGGVLRIIETTSPGTPIGAPWETSGGSVTTQQFSLQAFLREEIDGSMTPMLATSYDIVATGDNPSITFYLRKGVKFSDGTDFNAAAAKFNLDMFKQGGMVAGTTSFWKSVEAIDDYTVRINYTEYRNTLLRSMGDAFFFVSPTAYQQKGIDWLRWNMVGTGPFLQSDFQRDVSFTGTKNPNYWESGKPYLDQVKYLYVVDQTTRESLFKSGGADEINAGPQVAFDLKDMPGTVQIATKGGPSVLVPDSLNSDSPWSNLKVRQAVEYAIDKESLAKTFGFGYGQAAYQMPSPSSMAYDPALPARKYDPAKAKQLLTDAGYPNGFKTTIIANPAGLNRDIPVAIQAYLKAVGITVELQYPEAAQMQTYLSGTWKNAALYTPLTEWANYNTSLNFQFGYPVSSWYKSLKKPDDYGAKFLASIRAPKPDAALLKAVVDSTYNDEMIIPLVYSSSVYVLKDTIKDSGVGTRGSAFWWNPQDAYYAK